MTGRITPVPTDRVKADMWFDPLCPWAWITSRWLLEVEQVRASRHRFPRDESRRCSTRAATIFRRSTRRKLAEARGPVRVAIAAEQKYGNEALRRPLHRARHPRPPGPGDERGPELLEGRARRLRTRRGAGRRRHSTEFDEALRASHEAGMRPVGMDVGTPVIHAPGPDGSHDRVLRPGDHAGAQGRGGRQAVGRRALVAGTPGFFEIKRTRDVGPIFT